MRETTDHEWLAALREHEFQMARLSGKLAAIDDPTDDPATHLAQRVFLTAQITRHEINLALLASRMRATA